MTFKKGDRVVAVDTTGSITKGVEYIVRDVSDTSVYVEGKPGGYFPRRFKLVHSWINKRTEIRRRDNVSKNKR